MARAKKTIKKVMKSVFAKKAPPAPKPEVPKESKIIKHLEELRMKRRDAAIIWEEINENHSDEEIRELIRSKNFGTLLGEVEVP